METQLIIRAPNQNIEDQVINCSMDWTVLKLKIHLSEVYPNSPVVKEQKLIYSGHLLQDHWKLKDIIKQEDMQSNTQILHLVYYRKYSPSSPEEKTESSSNQSSQSSPEVSPELIEDNIETSENTLRYRANSVDPSINAFQPQLSQPTTNPLPVFPNDPQMLAQMVAMQQMYAQYVSQYWQSMSMGSSTGNVYPVVSNTPLQPNNSSNVIRDTAAEQPVNQRVNAPAVQAVEENEAIRDWLDYAFLYLRFFILLSIVYFYSTPERFMLVITIVVIAFLYHEGWFVRQGIADINGLIAQRNRGQAEPNPNVGNNMNERPQLIENEGNDGHELEAVMDGEDPPHAQNADAANNNNQVFSPLTFLTTFFSSLIPEPPPPVNIN